MLARKSLLIMSSNILEGLLAYVALFFIARYMGPESYGIIGFAMGFVALFALLNNLGFNNAHIKQVSEGKDLGRCIGTFMTIKIALIGLMISAVIGAVFFWKIVMGRGFESPTHELAIYIMLGYFIAHGLGTIFKISYVARKEIAKAEIPIIVRAIARTAIILFVALLGYGPVELAFAYVFGDIFSLAVFAILFRGYPIKKPTKEYFKNYSQFAFPLILVSSSMIIMTNLDKVLIQLFWSSEHVGYYFASSRFTQFIVLASSSIGLLIFPTISSFHAKNNIQSIKKTIMLSERYISMLVFPMAIGIICLAEPIVRIFLSRTFYPAVSIFMILPFYTLLLALAMPFNYQLMGMNKPKLARNRVIIMVSINVVLNIILIPQDIQSLGIKLFGLGPMGAAIATVAAYAVGLIYCRIAANKLIKELWNPRVLLHLLAASVMGIILYWLSSVIYVGRWYHLLGFVAFGLAIYLFILYLLREFTRKEIDFLLDIFNIKKMFKYIKEEIRKEK
jgi:O-antigen/teichoic acid export membrane protein